MILSRTGAIWSTIRPARSSFNASGNTPNTSWTAHTSTPANGVGDVNPLAVARSYIRRGSVFTDNAAGRLGL